MLICFYVNIIAGTFIILILFIELFNGIDDRLIIYCLFLFVEAFANIWFYYYDFSVNW